MIEKLKESFFSIGPIALIVLLLSFTITPMGIVNNITFVFCAILTIIGLALFLLGADVGIIPIGEKAGASLTSKKNLPLLLIGSFIIGFIITIAEPDVQVLANQVASVNPSVNPKLLLIMIAIGIGFFVSLGLLRIVFQYSIKLFYCVFYVIVFVLAFIAPKDFFAVAFDASGATTGPMTVPFILALGMGVAAVMSNTKNNKSDNFGLTGLASIGPILAVLLMSIFFIDSSSAIITNTENVVPVINDEILTLTNSSEITKNSINIFSGIKDVLKQFPHTFIEVAKSLIPLIGLFIVFLIFLFKISKRQIIKIFIGLFYAFVGLILFFLGINGGFIPAGTIIGETLGALNYKLFLIILSIVLGAIVVCAEPAVWVLTKQVEEISGGTIRRKVLLAALSFGVSAVLGLAMVRVIYGFSVAYLLVPIFVIALSLTFFCPTMFTAIAFDSGGVASGPMTSSFILSFTLGVSTAMGGNPLTDAFGVIGLVASAPLIAIQILGLIYSKKSQKKGGEQ